MVPLYFSVFFILKQDFLRYLTIILLCYSISITSFSQEEFGILHSNYATTNAVEINPANGAFSKQYFDFNLIGVHQYVMNNYVYLSGQNYSPINVAQGNFEGLDVQYNTNRNKLNVYHTGKVKLPSAALSFGDHSFEIHADVKTFARVQNVPEVLAAYGVNGTIPPDNEYSNIKLGGLSYVEIGGGYSRILLKEGYNMLGVGLNINYLIGLGGGALRLNETDFYDLEDQEVSFDNVHAEYMYALPGWNVGRGFSSRLGVVYTRMEKFTKGYLHNTKQSRCNCMDYKWKLGASLLDIGSIKFKEVNYRNYTDNTTTYSLRSSGIVTLFDSIAESGTSASEQRVWNERRMSLPGAISLQGDFKLKKNLYLGVTYTYGFPKGQKRFGIDRPQTVSFTPRFEHKRFEFAFPISLYNWSQPQVGFMVRINNNLIIGTDNMAYLLGIRDVYGADIYAYFKFGKIKGRGCRTAKQKKGNGGTYTCPAFN